MTKEITALLLALVGLAILAGDSDDDQPVSP